MTNDCQKRLVCYMVYDGLGLAMPIFTVGFEIKDARTTLNVCQ